MRFLAKYGAYFFVINTLIYPTLLGGAISEYVFYTLMALTAFLILLSSDIIKKVILNKNFYFFLLLNVINVLYYLLFEIGELNSLKYLLARFVMFTLFSSSIFIDSDGFSERFLPFLTKMILFISFLGLILYPPSFDGRYMGLFLNPNEFSVLQAFAFAYIFLYYKNSTKKILLLLALAFLVMLSGSRGAILALAIPIVIRFRVSVKTIALFTIITFLMWIVSPYLSNLNSFERLLTNESVLDNRILELQYAYSTFMDKMLIGNGLQHYAYINKSLIASDHQHFDIGAHNGYLAILVQYGLLFSTVFFYLLFSYTSKIIVYLKNYLDDKKNQYILFVLVYTFFNGLFETTFTGINYFQTAMFWLCLCYALNEMYEYETVR